MEQASPMLKQYHSIKRNHQDCILFFRLGDFYEMFYEDAKLASRLLDLVLTSRGTDPQSKIPMCGVPHHAATGYIARLIKSGYKIAICEQLEDPAQAKGLVKRDVTRIITSGTFLDEQDSLARYLIALSLGDKNIGLSFIDPTSGTIQTNQIPPNTERLKHILATLPVCECVFPESQKEAVQALFADPLLKLRNIVLSPVKDWQFNPDLARKTLTGHFQIHNLHGFGIEELPMAVACCGALLEYLKQMNKQPLRHIDKISHYADESFVFISQAAYRGLELEALIKTIDHTLTPMGRRLLQFWCLHPLKYSEKIKERQNAVKLVKDDTKKLGNLKTVLTKIPDIDKNLSRLSCGYLHPKDVLAIRNTLGLIPEIHETVHELAGKNPLFAMDDIKHLREKLSRTINPDFPLANYEGRVVRLGVNKELDELRDIQMNGQAWLKAFQAEEIKRTGINSLKVGYNQVFGYYIEITKTHTKSVPVDYIRKQTLVNAERYITLELKEFEEKILTAEEKIAKIEQEIILDCQQEILDQSLAIHQFCYQIAAIDALYSLTVLAQSPGYVCPEVTEDIVIDIKDGRHPVVEKTLTEAFIPNDTFLDNDSSHLIILTGPNMAGKSTYIRQSAILAILAQMGSFIPARSASVGIVDKVFTRIGAHDDIRKGQSTFMVEMNETADILNNLTERSLIILDEIGRGTSTYDGLSLAWSLAEHLQQTRARTLFATHFHELTALAEQYPGVKNFNVAVKEWQDEIIFLHKIVRGGTDDSYGLYVAKLAGIPLPVIERARSILTQLELKNNLKDNLKGKLTEAHGRQHLWEDQLTFFSGYQDPVLSEVRKFFNGVDVNRLTPLEALNHIQKLKDKMGSNGEQDAVVPEKG